MSGLLYDEIEAFIDENYVVEQQIREYGYMDKCEASLYSETDTCSEADFDESETYYEDECYEDDVDETAEFYEDDSDEMAEFYEDDTDQTASFSSKQICPAPVCASMSVPRSLDDILANAGETFQQMLFRLIKEKGREEVEVYKGACKDKKLFYKIRNNVNYQPTKHTVYAFAISLKLSLQETRDLLQAAGFAMSRSNRFDLIMAYVFEREIYDMYRIDCILYDFGEEHYFSCE